MELDIYQKSLSLCIIYSIVCQALLFWCFLSIICLKSSITISAVKIPLSIWRLQILSATYLQIHLFSDPLLKKTLESTIQFTPRDTWFSIQTITDSPKIEPSWHPELTFSLCHNELALRQNIQTYIHPMI